jgi:NDP-sugar pyrophosphorylase family protein
MNIVIPMAGRGERFRKDGYSKPKPLINFRGKSMIEYAVESLGINGNFIFIVYKYSEESLNIELENILKKYSDKIISIDYITDGPASSALLAEEYINNNQQLIITNCDQIMSWDSKKFTDFINSSHLDGLVVTYDSETPKNSYVRMNNGLAEKFAEKQVISNLSLNGIHYWKMGSYFIESCNKMIQKNIRCNNEFYISLSYNEMVNDGLKVGAYHIDSNSHHAVGTPEDLEIYIKNQTKNGDNEI